MLDNASGNGLVTKGDAVEMLHVGVHLVYCCLRLKQEMRISEKKIQNIFFFFGSRLVHKPHRKKGNHSHADKSTLYAICMVTLLS